MICELRPAPAVRYPEVAAELDHRRRSMARSLSEGDDISMAVNGETGRIVTRDER